MDDRQGFQFSPIGYVVSPLKDRTGAPRQGWEGAPTAHLEIAQAFTEGLEGLQVGQDIWILTWLHQSQRSVLKVHPRDDATNPEMGVFATRSSDRPNPIGLHHVTVVKVEGARLTIGPFEAIDGTPILDIKPVLEHINLF